LAEYGNDLTDAAVALRPEIAQVLAFLGTSEGVLHAAMSGSGATCFALYEDFPLAERAAAGVPAQWWRYVGKLVAGDP
jgi:4-diphosphocytidyl-2-C-methyl-D-erythritol kinase